MTPGHWSFRELVAYDGWGLLDERVDALLCPHMLRVKEPESTLAVLLDRLAQRLGPDRAHLPAQALAAAVLCSGGTAHPAWLGAAVPGLIDPDRLRLGLDWQQLKSLRWSSAAIALAADSGVGILWALVGAGKGPRLPEPWPRWWPDVADNEAVNAVTTAFQLLADEYSGHYYFWPFLHSVYRPTVTGGSLALPVYLAGWSAIQGLNQTPGRILATGGLERRGRLLPVGYLDEKLRLAEKSGFSAFFCPAGPNAAAGSNPAVDRVAVRGLQDARRLFRLYSEADCRNLQDHFHCVQEASRLAANLHLIPEALFASQSWSVLYRDGVEAVLKSTSLCDQLAANIERCREQPDCSERLLACLLEPLTREKLLALGEDAPVTAFRLAQARLLTANHQGNIEQSDTWKQVSETLAAQVEVTEDGGKRTLDHLNRALLSDRHNHYDFRPELPHATRTRLEEMEHIVEILRQYNPFGGVNRTLGRFYGTIAQNYGFCGPSYLDQVEHYVDLAKRAFGADRNPELEQEHRRQLNYLVYAYLDAGKRHEAARVLDRYLGAPLEQFQEEQLDQLDSYQHAATARYLRDTKSPPGRYLDWTRKHCNDRPEQHPWQLWLTNAGRLLQSPEQRNTAWRNSFALCRQAKATMRIMALLPLAALYSSDLIRPAEAEAETRRLLDWLPQSGLTLRHFQPLLEAGSALEALHMIRRQPRTFFPFTYR